MSALRRKKSEKELTSKSLGKIVHSKSVQPDQPDKSTLKQKKVNKAKDFIIIPHLKLVVFVKKSTQLVSPHSSVVTGRWVERSKEFAGIPWIHMTPTKPPPIWSKWKPQLNLKLSFRPPNQSPKKLQLRQVWDLPCSGFLTPVAGKTRGHLPCHD